MGQMSSVMLQPDEDLYQQIMNKIKKSIEDSQFWLDQDLCDRLEIVYMDQLQQFDNAELIGVSFAIGIKIDEKYNKKKLCIRIVEYYKKRIQLMRNICLAVEKAHNLVVRAVKGPVCQGVKQPAKDFLQCHEWNGIWLAENDYQQMINKIKNTPIYDMWKENIDKLRDVFNHNVNKLLEIVSSIHHDVKHKLTDERLHDLVAYSNERIKKLEQTTELIHLIAINYR